MPNKQVDDSSDEYAKPGTTDVTHVLAPLSSTEARKALGQRIQHARELLGLNQAQLSALYGASKRGLQDNEAGKSVPGAPLLIALAQRGLNVHWVLTGEGPEQLADLQVPAAPHAESQPTRLDGPMMGRALATVRRLLTENGLESSAEGEGELAAILYEMYQDGYAWAAAERSVAALMRTTTSAIRGKRHEQERS